MNYLITSILAIIAAAMAYVAFARHRIMDIIDELPRRSGKQYGIRAINQITTLVIHHSASEGQTPYDYAVYHIQEKEWPGIAYHFVIQQNGEIFQTNHLETISYHVEGANTRSVGICLSGNLSNHPMTEKQEKSLIWLLRKLRRQLPAVTNISGHRDHKSTSCPGDYVDIDDIVSRL